MPRHAIPTAPSAPRSLDEDDLAKIGDRLVCLIYEDLGVYATFANALNETLTKAQRAWVLGYVRAKAP